MNCCSDVSRLFDGGVDLGQPAIVIVRDWTTVSE